MLLNTCIDSSLVNVIKVMQAKNNVYVCTQNCVVILTATISYKQNEIGIIEVHSNNV